MAKPEVDQDEEELVFDISQRAKTALREATERNPTDAELYGSSAAYGLRLTEYQAAEARLREAKREMKVLRARRGIFDQLRLIVQGEPE